MPTMHPTRIIIGARILLLVYLLYAFLYTLFPSLTTKISPTTPIRVFTRFPIQMINSAPNWGVDQAVCQALDQAVDSEALLRR